MRLRVAAMRLVILSLLPGCAVSVEHGPPGRLRTLERPEASRAAASPEVRGTGRSIPLEHPPGLSGVQLAADTRVHQDPSQTQHAGEPPEPGDRPTFGAPVEEPDVSESPAAAPDAPGRRAAPPPSPERFDIPPDGIPSEIPYRPRLEAADPGGDGPPPPGGPLALQDVIESVYDAYPLLAAAVQQRVIASGENLAAQGAFDLQLSGLAASMPLGFYEMHRFGVSATQPLFQGGETFAGYRIGRGFYPPWHGDRETKQGGEFRGGFTIPLAQNNRIDPRRALLFRTAIGQQEVEPAIQQEFIQFVQFASYAYWDWIAAGLEYRINLDLLNLAVDRVEAIRGRIEEEDIAPIELTDNERLIVSREALVIDAERRLLQAAIRLSLFLREPDGTPFVPGNELLPPAFPPPFPFDPEQLDADIDRALANRPELRVFAFQRQQLEVDLAQARNLYLPTLDAGLIGSQDVGAEPKAIRDKGPFELEAMIVAGVPLQRRLARGQILAVEGRLAQLTARLQFARDTVVTDVQNAMAALDAAYRQIGRASAALELARTMEEAERDRFEEGQSNILLVNLREQDTANAAVIRVDALLRYYRAEADYRAALALDAITPGG